MAEKRSQVRPRTGGHISIEQMAAEDGRYHPQAFYFVYEGLEHKLRQLGERRHLTAEELLDGLRQLALEQFGLLARTVLEQWGVSRTEDVGEMVYLLIEHGLLFRTEKDSKEEFKDVFDFRQAFDDSYQVPARL
jgi:uncharacterized repeat protein (TIGR04138 family)